MKKCMTVCLVVAMALVVGTASADFSWQTQPIMGTDYSNATGDVVMITGPTPTDGSGNNYLDVDGDVVLGPTIPHYSTVGDPLFGVGSPSMTKFYFDPDTFTGGHWTDEDTWIYSGSGINLNPTNTYANFNLKRNAQVWSRTPRPGSDSPSISGVDYSTTAPLCQPPNPSPA
jgi:hypothetical protein